MEEMHALSKNEIWDVADLQKRKCVVGCKWVHTMKYNPDGTVQQYKARLVAIRFTHSYGID